MDNRSFAQGQASDQLLTRVSSLVRAEAREPEAIKARHDDPALRVEAMPALDRMQQVWTEGRTRKWSARTLIQGSFLLIVVVPVLAMAFYTWCWATPRYVSELRIAVQTADPAKTVGVADLIGLGASSQASNQAKAVVQYIHSRNALEAVDRRLPLRASYLSDSVDFPARFHGKTDIEAMTRYWNKMVEAYYESSTSTIVVRVAAFVPVDALKIAQFVLADAEELVNRMSARARDDSVGFAMKNVEQAEARVLAVVRRFQELQDKEAMFDPMKAADMNIRLAALLKEQIAQRSADLTTLRTQTPNSPSVRGMEYNISSLRQELAKVEAEATSAAGIPRQSNNRPISSVLGAFEPLANERAFAEKAYQSAMMSLEMARMEASRQQVYLSVIVPPGLPEEADFPRPWRHTGLTLLVAGAIWLIGLLGVYSVREHM